MINPWRTPNALILFAFVLWSALPIAKAAGQGTQQSIGVRYKFERKPPTAVGTFASGIGGAPRWVKWGLVGAVAGGALFAMAGQSDTDHNHSAAGDALYGAATGFVVIGGSVALWDWLCRGDTKSRRSGMCGR